MKSKWKAFGDAVINTLLIILVILMITELVQDVITQVKVRNKIKEPEKCISINAKYYCEVEK